MEMVGGSLQAHFFQTSDQTSDFVTMADLARSSHGAGGINSILKLVKLVLIGSLSFPACLCSLSFPACLCSKFFAFSRFNHPGEWNDHIRSQFYKFLKDEEQRRRRRWQLMQMLEEEEKTKRWKCQREAKKVEEEKVRATRKSRRKKIEEVGEEKEVVEVIGIKEMSKCVEEGEKSDKKVSEEDISWLKVSEQLSDMELEEHDADGDFLLSSVAGEVLTVDNTNEESNTEQTLSCSPRCRLPRPSCPSRPHGA